VLLYRILKDNIEKGKYDLDLFNEYIKIGKSCTYIAVQFQQKVHKDPSYVQLYNLPSTHGVPTFNANDDEGLVRQHLHHFLKGKDSNYNQFCEWISDSWLAIVDAEAKLMYGEGEPEKYSTILGASR